MTLPVLNNEGIFTEAVSTRTRFLAELEAMEAKIASGAPAQVEQVRAAISWILAQNTAEFWDMRRSWKVTDFLRDAIKNSK